MRDRLDVDETSACAAFDLVARSNGLTVSGDRRGKVSGALLIGSLGQQAEGGQVNLPSRPTGFVLLGSDVGSAWHHARSASVLRMSVGGKGALSS